MQKWSPGFRCMNRLGTCEVAECTTHEAGVGQKDSSHFAIKQCNVGQIIISYILYFLYVYLCAYRH